MRVSPPSTTAITYVLKKRFEIEEKRDENENENENDVHYSVLHVCHERHPNAELQMQIGNRIDIHLEAVLQMTTADRGQGCADGGSVDVLRVYKMD